MASEKTCFKCNTLKPLTEFYVHAQMGDGYLNKCKSCTKRDVAEHRAANIEKIREYDRARSDLPHRVALRYAIVSRWIAENPERRQAQKEVRKAVMSGQLEKWPCMECGADAEAHHPDYSNPLAVVWLCKIHHRRAHWDYLQTERAA
jgi:hypothetical protein